MKNFRTVRRLVGSSPSRCVHIRRKCITLETGNSKFPRGSLRGVTEENGHAENWGDGATPERREGVEAHKQKGAENVAGEKRGA